MQHARDTFYVTLRDRLAALNPQRTVVVRGLSRPGVLVADNELASAEVIPDAFTLHWAALQVEARGSLPLATLECEIRYATDGSADVGGMDRGQLLGAMDAELVAALVAEPTHVPKTNYSSNPAAEEGSDVFWSGPKFGGAVANGERLSRTATVEVWCYLEAGEL